MPKSDNQKLSLLYILDYLERESDEDHPVNAERLVAMLSGHRIRVERKTV